jgi:hypothetical protein
MTFRGLSRNPRKGNKRFPSGAGLFYKKWLNYHLNMIQKTLIQLVSHHEKYVLYLFNWKHTFSTTMQLPIKTRHGNQKRY